MNRRAVYAVLLLAAAGFGYVWLSNRNAKKSQEQPQDQTPATVAAQYYTPPSNTPGPVSIPGQTFINGTQAMPLPYNT